MNNLDLQNYKSIKREVSEYNKLIKKESSEYSSLADMKRQIYAEFSTYSEEELDLSKEFVKSKITRMDKYISSALPLMTAIYLAAITVTVAFTDESSSWIFYVIFIAAIFFGTFESHGTLKRLNFYNMLLELIEKVEQERGHTFNDSLTENKEVSTTIS